MLEKGGIKIIYNSSNSGSSIISRWKIFMPFASVSFHHFLSLAFIRVLVYKILFIIFTRCFIFPREKSWTAVFIRLCVCQKMYTINTHSQWWKAAEKQDSRKKENQKKNVNVNVFDERINCVPCIRETDLLPMFCLCCSRSTVITTQKWWWWWSVACVLF
jgi:hypothetical protein